MRARSSGRDRGRVGGQRPRGRQLQGGRGREPGCARQRRGEDAAEAAGRDARLGERPRGAGHVRRHSARTRADRVEIEGGALAGGLADELDPPVPGRHEGDPDLEVDRGRQDEAEVVVGVLADEVDPAGCPDDADRPGVDGGRRLERGQARPQAIRRQLRGAGRGAVRRHRRGGRRRRRGRRRHRRTSPAGTTRKPGCSSRGVTGTACSRAALTSGSVSLMKSKVAVSTEARILVSRSER